MSVPGLRLLSVPAGTEVAPDRLILTGHEALAAVEGRPRVRLARLSATLGQIAITRSHARWVAIAPKSQTITRSTSGTKPASA